MKGGERSGANRLIETKKGRIRTDRCWTEQTETYSGSNPEGNRSVLTCHISVGVRPFDPSPATLFHIGLQTPGEPMVAARVT